MKTPYQPFFTHKDFYQCELTEVMRSNAPIIDVATDVRWQPVDLRQGG